MSIIGLAMNLLLAGLLLAALYMGARLNRRLQALRDSHDGFAVAVRELNAAAERAEQGLADLRAATDEATDVLADRIEKGRALASKLERLTAQPITQARGPTPPLPEADDLRREDRLGALLAAARQAREAPRAALREVPPPSMIRPRIRPEDDLFEDSPMPLSAAGGARR